jgi:hypothetical protein
LHANGMREKFFVVHCQPISHRPPSRHSIFLSRKPRPMSLLGFRKRKMLRLHPRKPLCFPHGNAGRT